MTSNAALFRTSQATMSVSIAIFLYEWFAYNIIYLGRILPAVGKGALITPFAVLFNVIWGLGMWSYARAHIADPGVVPKRWIDFVRGANDSLPIAPARPEWQPGKATYCKKCDVPRPERAHHCLYCEVCILRMDHHCPWINNCVGFRNHKFFLLLGIYALLASIIALATTLPELFFCMGALTQLEDGFVWGQPVELKWKSFSGYIPSGENILEATMTIAEAKDRCADLSSCKGFTFHSDHLVDLPSGKTDHGKEEEEEEVKDSDEAEAEARRLDGEVPSESDEAAVEEEQKFHMYFKDKWDIWGTGWVSYKKTEAHHGAKIDFTDILVFMIFSVLALMVCMLLTPMLATHLPLAFQNITTIEDNYENMPNPFDQGSLPANLAQVFGAYGPDWPFPVYPLKPLSDGVSFARSDERLGPDGLPERPDGDELDTEKLWRKRYHARTPIARVQEVMVDNGPLTSLAKWWNG